MSISKTVSQAEARETIAEMEKLRKRAARQAKNVAVEGEIPTADCTILPKGDGMVSMGEHFGGIGDAYFEEGDIVTLQLPISVALFNKGYVNFDGGKQASADAADLRASANRARREAEARARDEARDAD